MNNNILSSFLIVLSFISIFPIPQKFLPEWNNNNLKFFCVMLPLMGIFFGVSWPLIFFTVSTLTKISTVFRGFIMTLLTLSLTGGLHMDGFMDTCDAIFSHQNKETRLKILSDTHSGAFAVMGCVIILMLKSFLFAEIFSHFNKNFLMLALIPVYSRLGMGFLLNNMPFAKSDGLAVILGTSRSSNNNIFFAVIFIVLISLSSKIILITFIIIFMIWKNICLKIFGGITGDLLGAFVEISEAFMLIGAVIEICI